MKKSLIALAAAVVVPAVPTLAHADVTANVALTSKYKFRGQDQSDPGEAVLPAIQGGFDWSGGGFYLGNWNSSVGFLGGTEMDFYGGYAGEVAGFGYDVGLLHYYYPGSSSSADTTEVYAKVVFGPVSAKYSHTVSSKWFGFAEGSNTGYLELNGSYEVMPGISLIGHLGTTMFSSDAKSVSGLVNYTDYKIGASMGLGSGFTVEAAYVGATEQSAWEAIAGGDVNKDRVVLTLSKVL